MALCQCPEGIPRSTFRARRSPQAGAEESGRKHQSPGLASLLTNSGGLGKYAESLTLVPSPVLACPPALLPVPVDAGPLRGHQSSGWRALRQVASVCRGCGPRALRLRLPGTLGSLRCAWNQAGAHAALVRDPPGRFWFIWRTWVF